MKARAKIFLGLIFALTVFAFPAWAEDTAEPEAKYYKYAHSEAEYIIALPEAPRVETIWANTENIPYLPDRPKDGAIGEVALFERVDPDTDDFFEAKIIFLKAKRGFLAELDEKKIKETLKNEYKAVPLTHENSTFSEGKGSLKWGTLTGFSVDRNNRPIFNATHYLTGQQSIMIVKIAHTLQNKTFQKYYKALIDSITYHPM